MSAPNTPDPLAGVPAAAAGARSLAASLTAWYALAAFAMVAMATGCLYWALESHFHADEDALLADQAQTMRNNMERAKNLRAMLQAEVVDELAAQRITPVYLRILDPAGGLMIETPGMERIMPMADFPACVRDPAGALAGRQAASPSGGPFRIAAAAIAIPGLGLGTIQIAIDNHHQQGLLASCRRWLAALLAIALGVSVAGGYLIARRGLSPLRRFATAIGGISPARLDQRIAQSGLPAELSALCASFNAMLARLEDAFARLRRFSADIAHELRTPMNNLRGGVEVALGRARSPDEYREVLASALEECQRLSGLIDTLLFLARTESPQQTIIREELDLAHEIGLIGRSYGPMADEAGVQLGVEASGPLSMQGDRTLLQRAVGNLVENALAHTPGGGRILISASGSGDQVAIVVSDTGRGIPPDHLPFVFERFHRVEQARSNAGGHVGLGLSIVRSIAELHGGSAGISSQLARGTAVTLRLPRAKPT